MIEIKAKEKYDYEDFLEVIRDLRRPDGCPWDREQTHKSLRTGLTEESCELLHAINLYDKTGNADNMREELGDLLLQVVMHATIAEEEGLFTMEDVVDEVCKKMIRRHPHVFGDVLAENTDAVLSNWEEIKKKEKEHASWTVSPLRDIPEELPALTRATKVYKKAAKVYDRRQNPEELVRKVAEESEAYEQGELSGEEYVRGLLTAAATLSGTWKLEPEMLLSDEIGQVIDELEPEGANGTKNDTEK